MLACQSAVAERLASLTYSHAPDTASPPKLLDRVRTAIRVKHYSRRTEQAYVDWIRRYILFHKKQHPSMLGRRRSRRFWPGSRWNGGAARRRRIRP